MTLLGSLGSPKAPPALGGKEIYAFISYGPSNGGIEIAHLKAQHEVAWSFSLNPHRRGGSTQKEASVLALDNFAHNDLKTRRDSSAMGPRDVAQLRIRRLIVARSVPSPSSRAFRGTKTVRKTDHPSVI
jgi:hypothetical protein